MPVFDFSWDPERSRGTWESGLLLETVVWEFLKSPHDQGDSIWASEALEQFSPDDEVITQDREVLRGRKARSYLLVREAYCLED